MPRTDASFSSALKKAMNHLSQGNGEKVIAVCNKLRKRYPNNFDVLHLLGIGYQLSGRLDRALDFYLKALKVKPEGSASLFCNLSFAYLGTEEPDVFKAADYSDKARVMSPSLQEPYEISSDVAMRTGDPIKSDSLLVQALEINPGKPGLWIKRARALSAMGEMNQALSCVQRALEIDSGSSDAFLELGELRDNLGETELALEAYEAATELDSKGSEDVDRRVLFMLSAHGSPEVQIERALRIIRENETHIPAQLQLLQSGKYPGGTQRGVENLPKNIRQRSVLAGFAIAKGFEKEQLVEESFKYYQHANQLKFDRGPEYKLDKSIDHFAQIKAFYEEHADELLTPNPDLEDYPAPIFVLGMPRSGTSLTEQLLGSHSHIHPAGELDFLLALSKFGMHEFKGHPRQHTPDYWSWVRDTYLECLKRLSNGKPFVVDKMPHNFELIGFIGKLFPNAVIVHMVRDPMSTCVSVFKENFSGYHPYAQNLVTLANYYHHYLELMKYWHSRPGVQILDFPYELLVQNMRPQVELVLQRCGLEWQDQISDFHKSDRIVRTASNNQVRQPIYQSSLKSWKQYEKHLTPLISTLLKLQVIEEADLS